MQGTPQPLQAFADVLDLYVEVSSGFLRDVPRVEDLLADIGDEPTRRLVRAIGTTQIELASLANGAAIGHMRSISLCLRPEVAPMAFSVFPLIRSILEVSATVYWLSDAEPASKEGLRRLVAAYHDAEVSSRGRSLSDLAGSESRDKRVRELASQLQLGRLTMPTRAARVQDLAGSSGKSDYNFLSGLAHGEPADLHNVISFATDRGEQDWSRSVAVVAAIFVVRAIKAHRASLCRLIRRASGQTDYASAQVQLQECIRGLVKAASVAAPAHW